MNRTLHMNIVRMVQLILTIMSVIIGTVSLSVTASEGASSEKKIADLVVYGKRVDKD